MPLSVKQELLVADADSGQRLDRYLASQLPELSRTRIQELIEEGLVAVDGKPKKGSHKLRAAEKITIDAQARPPLRAEAEDIPLDILYEDADVIAINKAAGMTVHAGAGNTRGTLVNALLGRGKQLSTGGDALRPGIVHRLDKDTSGVILVAKNDFAHAKLSEEFQRRIVKKTYIALVEGSLKESQGRIELPIGRDPNRRTRMAAQDPKSAQSRRRNILAGPVREARTDWRTLAQVGGTTLLEVQLHTGRTHQIRVHLSAMKHPIVGDVLYGAAPQLQLESKSHHGVSTAGDSFLLPPLGRNFLHAVRLGFAQPRNGQWIEVLAPLPPELREFLRRLADASGDDPKRIDAALATYL